MCLMQLIHKNNNVFEDFSKLICDNNHNNIYLYNKKN